MANDLNLSPDNFWLRPNPRYEAGSPIAVLFQRLTLKFGTAWTSAYTGATSLATAQLRAAWEREWADALTKAKVRPAQVRIALSGCNRLKRPPTLAEFLALALPVPDVELAYREAVRNLQAMRYGKPFKWTHPAIYWASMALGPDTVRGQSWTLMRPGWTRCLNQQLRRLDWPAAPKYDGSKTEVANEPNRHVGLRSVVAIQAMLNERQQRTMAIVGQAA